MVVGCLGDMVILGFDVDLAILALLVVIIFVDVCLVVLYVDQVVGTVTFLEEIVFDSIVESATVVAGVDGVAILFVEAMNGVVGLLVVTVFEDVVLPVLFVNHVVGSVVFAA